MSVNHRYNAVIVSKNCDCYFYLLGKTIVARFLGNLFYMMGLLSTDKIIEVGRIDLVREFVSHKGLKT